MELDVNLGDVPLERADDIAAAAETMGYNGAWVSEVTGSPYTRLTRVVDGTDNMDIGSAIALAFPRSPMVTAYTAWDLQRLSSGRFHLGLGTQVKGHNERRFSVEWESPGPKLRDYIKAVRTIWEAWTEGREPDYHGEFYSIDLCPPDWRPEPIDDPAIPIFIGGVNEYNLRLAGELCDGLHIHPLNSPKYISEVVVPNVEKGAERTDRDIKDVTLATSAFAITGETENAREEAREEVKYQIAFYGSTPTYRKIFEVHGWDDVCDDLHQMSKDDEWDQMADLISAEMVDTFAVEAPWGELRDHLGKRYTYVDRLYVTQTSISGGFEPFRGEEHWKLLID
jgi:probable F420-dependent oxidoreductase